MTDPFPRPIAAIRLDGGRLCIDFVNTIHDRFAFRAEDYVTTPDRYAAWALRAGALRSHEDIGLPRAAADAARLMEDVRSLREALHRLLAAQVDGVALPADALRTANEWLLAARRDQELSSDGRLLLRAGYGDARIPLKRIALDLVDTLAMAADGEVQAWPLRQPYFLRLVFRGYEQEQAPALVLDADCGAISKMAALRQRSSGTSLRIKAVNPPRSG